MPEPRTELAIAQLRISGSQTLWSHRVQIQSEPLILFMALCVGRYDRRSLHQGVTCVAGGAPPPSPPEFENATAAPAAAPPPKAISKTAVFETPLPPLATTVPTIGVPVATAGSMRLPC
jgi:hypothetical protein